MSGPRPRQRAAWQLPVLEADEVPWLSVEQMREVDRAMIEELGISLVRMMENAGRSLAVLARLLLGGSVHSRRVLVMCGPGGNGGGGLVAARHLTVAGALVDLRLASPPERLTPVPAEQLQILRRMGLRGEIGPPSEPIDADLVIDALLGYSQAGDPRGDAARLIEWSVGRRILSLDNPSGLELSTGRVRAPCVQADATMTLALPKDGLRAPAAKDVVGRLFLADISVPALVYKRLGLHYRSPFAASAIVELDAYSGTLEWSGGPAELTKTAPRARDLMASASSLPERQRADRVADAISYSLEAMHLRRTVPIAVVVGVVLTAINQLDVLLSGHAGTGTYVKCALNFVVPFVVSNLGLLSGRSPSDS